jgi:PAS domain S-box-containing protein
MNVPESSPSPSASILLVDDHPANVVALEAILAPLGHELCTASSGEEALRQLLRRDFALILLDVQMAGLDGFQTANLIKQRPRSRYIPIIFITAVGRDANHVFRGYSEGAVDYLVKPFDPDILRSKVQVFVDLHVKEEQLKAQAKLLREHERDALLRAGEERYRHLLDVMPQSIWASDAEGRITFWNRASMNYLGHEAGALTGESLWSALHAEDRASVREAFEEGFARKEAFERQIRLRRASDGTYRWHLARVVPERGSDGDGAIAGWIATATDIDDQKKAEQVLREAISLREDFLSVASHELRTPLTSLRLEVENLLRFARRKAGEAAGDVIQRTERIDAQAARLNHLIDELLDVSRIAAGRLELQIEEVDLVAVVDEVRTRLGDEAQRRGCVLDVRGLERAVGAWDASRLDQVITNLLSNAIKYGAGKPIEITVDVTGDRAVLAVHDHGLGIPAEDQDRIFRRFERAASSRNYSGIGLGLWIVKQIVEALGGTVSVDSRPELGATFTVELPTTRPAATGARATAGAARPETRRGARGAN